METPAVLLLPPTRPRSWFRRIKRGVSFLVLIFVVVFVALMIRFKLGKTSITTNYLAKRDAKAIAVSQAQWAWPVYQQLIAEGGGLDGLKSELDTEMIEASPEWIAANGPWLARLRDATELPVLGYIHGDGTDSPPGSLLSDMVKNHPHYASVRQLANLLADDLLVSRKQGDAARVRADLDAIFNLSRQMHYDGPLLAELIAAGIDALGVLKLQETLQETPGLLSDGDLTELSGQLARYKTSSDVLSVSGERDLFDDAMQQVYTPSGRLASDGLANFTAAFSATGTPGDTSTIKGTVLMVLLPSRQETESLYHDYVNAIEAAQQRRFREVAPLNTRGPIDRAVAGRFGTMRYIAFTIFGGSLERAVAVGERFVTEAEAARLAIALEQSHRREGRYPNTLDALVPRDIEALPLDPATGGALLYTLRDGKPFVYSLGTDRDDDGGKLYHNKAGEARNSAALDFDAKRIVDADYIMIPVPADE